MGFIGFNPDFNAEPSHYPLPEYRERVFCFSVTIELFCRIIRYIGAYYMIILMYLHIKARRSSDFQSESRLKADATMGAQAKSRAGYGMGMAKLCAQNVICIKIIELQRLPAVLYA